MTRVTGLLLACSLGFVLSGCPGDDGGTPDASTTTCGSGKTACGTVCCDDATETCSAGGVCKAKDICVPESEASFCLRMAAQGKVCGSITANDNCGTSKTIDCGGVCAAPTPVCDSTNKCVAGSCTPEDQATFCSRMVAQGKVCGSITANDNCGTSRTVDCGGVCAAPTPVCDSATNKCVAGSCTPENQATFCSRMVAQGKVCGSITANDNCGTSRTIDCGGVCAAPTPVCDSATNTCISGGPLECNPALVISQIYSAGGNTNAQYKQKYVELHNRGTTPIALSAWTLQYASATGNFSATANRAALSGTIQPAGYYLVQIGAAGTNGVDLPATATPDLTVTGITPGSPGGKYALATSGNLLTVACPAAGAANVADFVFWGTATCSDSRSAAPAPNVTTAIARKGAGCTDSNDNAADFEQLDLTVPTNLPHNASSATLQCTCTGATCGSGLTVCGSVCCDPTTQMCSSGSCISKGTGSCAVGQTACGSSCCDRASQTCTTGTNTCQAMPSGSCDQAYPTNCSADQGCYYGDTGSVCSAAGNVPVNGTCSATAVCVPGSDCLSDDTNSNCYKMCDAAASSPFGAPGCTSSQYCWGLDYGVGYCDAIETDYPCSPYSSPSGCPSGQGCYYDWDTGGVSCSSAGSKTAGQSCADDPECAPGLVCSGGTNMNQCSPACNPFGDNTCPAANPVCDFWDDYGYVGACMKTGW